jgi:hypothetical protein
MRRPGYLMFFSVFFFFSFINMTRKPVQLGESWM